MYNYELLVKKGIRIKDKNIDILFGMTKDEIEEQIKESPYSCSITTCKYPKKIELTECKCAYENLYLYLEFVDNKLEHIQIPLNVILLYKNINLSDKNYMSTLKELKRLGFKVEKDSVPVVDEFIVNELNISFLVWNEKCDTLHIFSNSYIKRRNYDKKTYYAKMSRDKENNVIIKYTNISKEHCDK